MRNRKQIAARCCSSVTLRSPSLLLLVEPGARLWDGADPDTRPLTLIPMLPSAALLDGLFHRSGDAIAVLDATGFLDANPAALALYGLKDRSEIVGLHPADLSPPEQPDGRSSREAAEGLMERAAAEGSVLFEWRHRRADGALFSSEIMLVAFEMEGRPAFAATIRDISRRVEAEEALRASQANLQLILDSLPGRVAWIDAERRHRYVNRQYEEFVGRPVAEIVGRTVEEMLGAPAWERIRAFGDEAMAGRTSRWEGWLSYRGGNDRYVSRTYAPRQRPDGAIDGYFVFAHDMTEQKRAEEELARQREALHQAEKMTALGSLLAGVAHELNNPLAVVVTQAALLQETAKEPSAVARAGKIQSAADRCARIVRSFLAIARQKPPQRGPVPLRAVLSSALELTAYGLRSSGVEASLEVPEGCPDALGDPDLLAQVFMNLIVNAEHALHETAGARRLAVSVEPGAETLTVRVADNGPGVPAAIRPRIFEPFFTTKPVGAGTGVGLAVSHGIVEGHGGSIAYEETLGGGATFAVTLPRADRAAPPIALPEEPPPAVRGRSILIVDDEPDIVDMLAEIVAPLASRIDVAANGREALRLLEASDYDVVISDLRMPELDGPGLARCIPQAAPHFTGRLIFVTGDTLGGVHEGFLRETGHPLIEKPFHPSEVRRLVSEAAG